MPKPPRNSIEHATSPIFTVGHSTRSLDDFIALLRHYGIQILIDIRRFPTSKKFPWFTKERLRKAVENAGIRYIWLGEQLGGYRKGGYEAYQQTPSFRKGVQEVIRLAKEEKPLALMCAELLWFRCHRRFVADTLTRAGYRVVHIYDTKRFQVHRVREKLEEFF